MNTLTGIFPPRRALPVLMAVLLWATGCSNPFRGSNSGLPRGTVEISRGGKAVAAFDVELALTPQAQATGLMNRKSMPEDEGMAFVFANPVRMAFYMKDTLIPLDIAFWDEDGEIVSVMTMAPCTEDPCELYDPGTEFVGALEVNGGLFESKGVTAGDQLSLEKS